MEKQIGYISLGCAKNLIDTEVMLGLLTEEGYHISEDLENAEYIIINTCTFIEKAKEQSINTILEAAKYKEKKSCKGLIVAGCLSQQYGDELFCEIPEIDGLLGTGSWNRILEAIKAIQEGKRAKFMDDIANIYDERMPRMQVTPGYSAYVKISEGCNNGCTFCIIPKVRGHYRSRTIESIVDEVKNLAKNGVKEINLIAQDLTYYGADLATDKKPQLVKLLKELVKIEGIKWIRLLYAYPKYFSDELLDLIVSEPKICNYIDIPLQHINDEILKAMNRKDSRKDIETLLAKIRSAKEHITIRTSLIVGFPGETEEQFEELCNFVEKFKFDNLGVFTYSQEEGTVAGAMSNQISEEEKDERYHRIMAIQAKVSEENNRDLENTLNEAIIEDILQDEEGNVSVVARLKTQAPEVDGNIYLEEDNGLEIGEIVPVRIVQGFAYDVVGEVLK